MSKIKRQIANEAVTLGQPITINLPRNYAYRGLTLRLAGSLTGTGGDGAGTSFEAGCLKLISKVSIRRNGKDTIMDLTGEEIFLMNQVLYGCVPQITNTTGAIAANVAVNALVKIPFENILGIKKFDTLMQSVGLSSLDMVIEIASSAGVCIDGGTTVFTVGTTTFTLNVASDEESGAENFVFGDIRMYKAQSVPVTGASSSFQIKPLSVGNMYKGFLLITKDTGTAGELDSTIIDNIKLKSGVEVFIDQKANSIREEMKIERSIETLKAGVYYIDLMPDGRLNQCLDVRPETGRQSLEFDLVTLAPTTAGNIDVIALEYIPPVQVVKK